MNDVALNNEMLQLFCYTAKANCYKIINVINPWDAAISFIKLSLEKLRKDEERLFMTNSRDEGAVLNIHF